MLWVALAVLATALVLLIANHESGMVGTMDADRFADLVYLSMIGLVVASGLLFSYRNRMGEALRHGLTWLAGFIILVAGYAFKDEFMSIGQRILAELVPGSTIVQRADDGAAVVELRQRADGHFAAIVNVNGTKLPMMVDTGASNVVLSYEDARTIGIDTDRLFFDVTVDTANGRTKSAPVRLNHVAVGTIGFDQIQAFVSQPGALSESLLGISFLSRLESYEVRGNRLVLRGRPDR